MTELARPRIRRRQQVHQRWQRSVYVDDVPRRISVALEELEPVERRTLRPIIARVQSILLVIDTLNSLPGTDGRTWSLADFAASEILVVVFTCNHCPTAQAYEERIKQLVTEYRDRGVALVAVSPNDPKAVRLDELGYSDMNDTLEEMVIRARDMAYNFPYLYDGDAQAVSRAYGPVAEQGAQVYRFVVDNDRSEQVITAGVAAIR